MKPAFTRAEIEQAERSLLHQGRFANAQVWRCRMACADWVIKDFRAKHPLVRWTIGRFLLGRELKALLRLNGLEGIPQDAFRVDRHAIAFRFVPGKTISQFKPWELPPDYFTRLEKLVHAMHERGIAHLDMRYRQNLLVTEGRGPGIIDFQSQVGLTRLPGWLRRHFIRVDLSGIYKQWEKRAPATLDEHRRAFLHRQSRLRKFWIIKGYGGRA